MGVTGVFRIGAVLALALAAVPAQAQFSDRYNFLKAVRDADGAKTQEYLNRPGTPELDSRDSSTGETALHIVVKRHDLTWLGVLLGHGARTEIRDNQGETPLLAAARLSDNDAMRLLLQRGANVNAADSQGATPLVIAVQHRDLVGVRTLLASGADPRIPDHLAGKSARDYAAEDTRSGTALLKLLDEAKPKGPAVIAGPVRK